METETTPNTPIVRAVGVIDENKNFIPYGSTAVAKGIPVFVFNTKAEYDEHAPTLPEPCVVITLDDIDTGGFEFDSELSDTSENAVQNKVIKAALEALKEKASFTTPGMVQFTDATTVTDRNSGYALSAIEKNANVEGTIGNEIEKTKKILDTSITKFGVSAANISTYWCFGDHTFLHAKFDYVPVIPETSNFLFLLTLDSNDGNAVRGIVAFPQDFSAKIFVWKITDKLWNSFSPTQIHS